MPITAPSTSDPSRTRCWRCVAPIDAEDRFCRRCGEGQGAAIAWYYRPAWIFVLALTALGPFVLPLIWRTPHLQRNTKWIASIVVGALTVYIGWQIVVAVREVTTMLSSA